MDTQANTSLLPSRCTMGEPPQGKSPRTCLNSLICAGLSILLQWGGFAPAWAAANEAVLWESLASGNHFALLRHAIAPGMGDPDNFTIGDCTTQRTLSDRGRTQATAIGNRFRQAEIAEADVYSSQWCRCLETAELLELGTVRELPLLNSFFQHYERAQTQTSGLQNWLAGLELSTPLVLVTHQVNITALTNIYPDSGELVIVRRDRAGTLSVAGTIQTE